MIVRRIRFDRFRNIDSGDVSFCDGINVIYGENAQGKTNILEALWLFTGAKSFRAAKESELVAYDKSSAELKLDFFAENREQSAEITVGEGKHASLNGIERGSVSKFGGMIKGVIFSPDHLSLIKDGPAARRRFIDAAVIQLKSGYASLLAKYNRAVTQRNSVLRDVRFHADLLAILDAYERQVALLGAKIIRHRLRYLQLINKYAPDIYSGLSGGRESIGIAYIRDCAESNDEPDRILPDGELPSAESIAADLFERLKACRDADILSGVTSVGPHRDDLLITINGRAARRFGSQGQQRSCVLTLKLCEASVLFETAGEQPLILLDDVMSELDEQRQDYILNHIGNRQVFITCCDKNTIDKLKRGRAFLIENGRIQPDGE